MNEYASELARILAESGLAFVAGSTGGGCMALCFTDADGVEWLVTNGDADLPDGEGTTLVRRDEDSDHIVWESEHDVDAAGAAFSIVGRVRRG